MVAVHNLFTGMATLRKLPSGRWNVQIRKKGRPPQTKTFRTKAAAERWARSIEHQFDSGSFVDTALARETTVGSLLSRYAEEVTPRKRSRTKEASRIGMLTRDLGDVVLADLTADMVIVWARRRLKTVSSDTVRKDLDTLSHAIDIASLLWGLHLPQNPVKTARKALGGAKALTQGVSRERRLAPGEFRRILKASSPEHRALWVWFVESAMRRGEVAGILPEHRRGSVLRIPDTKTGKPRSIPVTRHMARVWGALPIGIRPDSITQAFERACKRAGVEGLRLHDLRHEATSRLFEKGLDIQEVATITGHSTWSSLKRYTHPSHESIVRKLAAARPGTRPYP